MNRKKYNTVHCSRHRYCLAKKTACKLCSYSGVKIMRNLLLLLIFSTNLLILTLLIYFFFQIVNKIDNLGHPIEYYEIAAILSDYNVTPDNVNTLYVPPRKPLDLDPPKANIVFDTILLIFGVSFIASLAGVGIYFLRFTTPRPELYRVLGHALMGTGVGMAFAGASYIYFGTLIPFVAIAWGAGGGVLSAVIGVEGIKTLFLKVTAKFERI